MKKTPKLGAHPRWRNNGSAPPPGNQTSLVTSDGSPVELVQDFKYLGGFTDSGYDMNTRICQAWSALNSLDKIWKAAIKNETKLKVFKASVAIETILLYGSESWTLNVARSKKLDGSCTKMLRAVYNISWRDHVANKSLYGRLPRISIVVKRRRLALAGHVSRHSEPAGMVLLWSPEVKRRVGISVKTLPENDTGLSGSATSGRNGQGRIGTYNFVVPGLSEPLF